MSNKHRVITGRPADNDPSVDKMIRKAQEIDREKLKDRAKSTQVDRLEAMRKE